MRSRILPLLVLLAACNDPTDRRTVPTSANALVIPTLGTAPTIRRLTPPKGLPGPTRVDVVDGIRLGDGSCDYVTNLPDKHPAYALFFYERDDTRCKAVIGQMHWGPKLDSLTGMTADSFEHRAFSARDHASLGNRRIAIQRRPRRELAG